jgi:hypothetical protein
MMTTRATTTATLMRFTTCHLSFSLWISSDHAAVFTRSRATLRAIGVPACMTFSGHS